MKKCVQLLLAAATDGGKVPNLEMGSSSSRRRISLLLLMLSSSRHSPLNKKYNKQQMRKSQLFTVPAAAVEADWHLTQAPDTGMPLPFHFLALLYFIYSFHIFIQQIICTCPSFCLFSFLHFASSFCFVFSFNDEVPWAAGRIHSSTFP